MKNGIAVLSGTSNEPLAEKICEELGVPLTPVKIGRYSNENLYVQIQESVRQRAVFIVQSIYPNPDQTLHELFLMTAAARSASADDICVVMPHYSYARSDKKDAPHIAVAGMEYAKLMITSGADRFLTMTLHSEHVQAFFNPKPADQLSGAQVISDYIKDNEDLSNAVSMSDLGQAKRAGNYAEVLDIPSASYDKVRLGDKKVEIRSVLGEVEGKDVWLFDDEFSSAVSIVTIAELIHEKYRPRSINTAAVHGLLTGDAVRLLNDSPIKKVIVTNSVHIPEEKRIDKLHVLDVGPFLAEGIRRIYNGEPVSPMFYR